MSLLVYTATFAVVALAAWQIGRYATRLRLPLIGGYLLAGILAGPFLLDIVPWPTLMAQIEDYWPSRFAIAPTRDGVYNLLRETGF